MRAVNLIPVEARPGAGTGAAGRSGGAVYVLLGGLAVLVVLVGVWALTGKKLAEDKAKLVQLQTEAATAQAQSSKLASFGTFHQLREQRTQTVKQLAVNRIDWADALDAIARTLPAGAWLSSMTAGTSPVTAPGAGAGNSGAVASSATGPSIQIGGCIGSQARVARLMPRLRAIPHVTHVSLVSSQSDDATSAGGSTSTDCRAVSFQMVLFFESTLPAAPAPAAAPIPAETKGEGQ